MDRIDAEFSNLKRRVHEECRQLNHRYTLPAKVVIERSNDAWELPAFKLIDPSGRTYFLFALSSDVKREDVIVWMGLERWRVASTNRLPDRIIVEGQREELAELSRVSEFDDLMPIYNRKSFDNDLVKLSGEAKAENEPLTLLLVDLDNFKAVNDTYGHRPVGDEVLIDYAKILKAGIEGKGNAYRLSGGADEVAILLPNFSLMEGEAVAERLRKSFEDAKVSRERLSVRVSIGVACFPDHAGDPESLFQSADKALYQAKKLGRNLVRISGEPDEIARRERKPDRHQPNPEKLSEEEKDTIRRAYLTEGRATCPRDQIPLKFVDVTNMESKTTEFLVSCPYCGLHDGIP